MPSTTKAQLRWKESVAILGRAKRPHCTQHNMLSNFQLTPCRIVGFVLLGFTVISLILTIAVPKYFNSQAEKTADLVNDRYTDSSAYTTWNWASGPDFTFDIPPQGITRKIDLDRNHDGARLNFVVKSPLTVPVQMTIGTWFQVNQAIHNHTKTIFNPTNSTLSLSLCKGSIFLSFQPIVQTTVKNFQINIQKNETSLLLCDLGGALVQVGGLAISSFIFIMLGILTCCLAGCMAVAFCCGQPSRSRTTVYYVPLSKHNEFGTPLMGCQDDKFQL
ncbi:hypothetical protein PROFUN_04709 [Planoprotostelium fungivorum]|uniref:Uncharacterized protein n=1 Tax=Planoprotostelium fungivorum TaxID=1890364 RepID=A0A2P6NFV7_9EUKA|nr:hypothetical protein PROFUN_04709 [Planoprotostelium fungivorum]